MAPPSPRGRRGALPSPSGRGVGGEGLRRLARQPPRQPPGVVRPLRTVAAEGLEAGREVDGVTAEPALGDDDRDLAGRPRVARARRVDRDAGKTRRQREARDRAAFVGDAALCVDRADRPQKGAGLGERRPRRRIEKGEPGRIDLAPDDAIEQKPRQVGGEDFWLGVRLEAARRGFLPQPIADAGLDAAGAASSLVGVGERDAHRLESRQAHVRLVARDAHEARVRSPRARPRW